MRTIKKNKITISRIIFLTVLSASLIGCGRRQYSLEKYIQNPPKSDSTCIKDIRRAKTMVENGEIVFCYPLYFGSWGLRQEKQLRLLCEQHGLIFSYEIFSCIIDEKQRQGCFSAYMDKIVADKYGADFKHKLLAQADSIMIAVNDTVPYYLCDKEPKIPSVNNDYESKYLIVQIPEEIHKQLKANNDGKLPFMDVGFCIDKEGNASGYFLNDFYDANSKENQLFQDDLFNISVAQLKQIECWESGIVNNRKVITKNNVRVHFSLRTN